MCKRCSLDTKIVAWAIEGLIRESLQGQPKVAWPIGEAPREYPLGSSNPQCGVHLQLPWRKLAGFANGPR